MSRRTTRIDPDAPVPAQEAAAEQEVAEQVEGTPPCVTLDELLALRRSIDAISAAENAAGRANAAQTAVDWVDRELDQAGVALVNGFAVPHGSTFNERTSAIDGEAKPGDRVWTKAAGWAIIPAPPK